nr:nibrin [Drosophila takahashii]
MFVLTNDEEKFVLLPAKKVYTVGRLATDLIVAQDLSISRNHVKIHLPDDLQDDCLQIEDLGSRYGTFTFPKNSQKPRKVAAKVMTPVAVGTRVRFGANSSIWQVNRLNLVTTVSALTRPEIQELAEIVQPMGGTVSPNWTDNCSHLTMNEASVTVKLLHAMLENKPIVTFGYWRKLLQAAQSIHVKEGWPQPEDYQPTNMDVTWRPERTRLFAGKTFVFMNRKHFEMYGSVVQKAGAACKDINSGVRKTFLTKSDVIVIQYVPSTQSQATESINSIQDILEQGGRRIIQEYEIGMALIHCSTKEFCNPAHKIVIGDSLPSTESVTSSMAFNSSIIVPNTERSAPQSSGSAISELVVPESDEPLASANSLRKRSHAITVDSSDEEKEATASKRAKSVLSEKLNIKAKNDILQDSSEDEEPVKPPANPPSKRTRPAIAEELNSKAKNDILLDSSDDEETAKTAPKQQMTRRSKAVCEEKSLPPPNKNLPARGKRVYCVDSSDEENENSQEPKKKTESLGVTRISPRLNAKAVATNITNQPPKRPVLSVALDDDDDDEGLFQFRKTPQKAADTAAKPKSTARISVINFLEKSQAPPTSIPSELNSQSQTHPRKRLRLELLNESDSDDCENLFNFADSKKKKKKQQQEDKNNEDSTDGLFNFNSERPSDAIDQDSVLTEPFLPEVGQKNKSKYVVVQRKERKKVDISGWLSCSRLHDDIKSEADAEVKLEASIKADPDEEKWLAAMKDSIQVRMCNLTIVNRSQADEVDASLGDSVSKYSGRKNFKKFVKTKNPHPQRRIVALKSLQLADGMVTCV